MMQHFKVTELHAVKVNIPLHFVMFDGFDSFVITDGGIIKVWFVLVDIYCITTGNQSEKELIWKIKSHKSFFSYPKEGSGY